MITRNHKHRYRFVLFAAAILFMAFAGSTQAADGLNVTIENVAIDDSLQPVVTFVMSDDNGQPVSRNEVSPRFIIACLNVIDANKGITRYTNYATSIQTVPAGYENAGVQAVNGSYDSSGTYQDLGGGRYRYTFKTKLPEDYDRTLTHTVGAQIQRNAGEKSFIANPLYHFVPDGSTVTQLRKVATTEGCNKCHTSLGLHGGGRREIGYCILCHNPQSTDPDTGNTIDMPVMIHKIHRGANLPSVQAGGHYKIIGYRQSVNDYSDVHFPQDIRNCEACHTGPDKDVYRTAPSRAVCSSCHDDIDFAAGTGHIPQANDDLCTACHTSSGEEFALNIPGAHTIPNKSKKLKGLNAEIVEVTNAGPGLMPIVRYTLTENDGTQVDPLSLTRLRILFAGPTREYTNYLYEDVAENSFYDGNSYTYSFTTPLPDNAKGTYSFAMEARRSVTVKDNPGDDDDIVATEMAKNMNFLVAITDSSPVERRKVVDQQKCLVCHDMLSFHGSVRNQVDHCVKCHNPLQSDVEERPEGVVGGESVSFDYMIHKIHKGSESVNKYLVYGHNSSENDFQEINFPGMIAQCSICHIDEVPSLPLSPDKMAIDFKDAEGNTVNIAPTTGSCTSCHETMEAIAHAQLNTTAAGVEACAVCHKAGRNSDIVEAHKNRTFLNAIETIGEMHTSVGTWAVH